MAAKKKSPLKIPLVDVGVTTAYVGAIAVLLMVGCYVISRISSQRVYNAKWKDYIDCGIA